MQAIILAGGYGTRLQGILPGTPKPLARIAGRPFLALVLDELETQGFRQVVMSIGYLGTAVMEEIGDRHGSIDIRYCREDHPLGTGGALRKALEMTTEEVVFALNGDTFFALDYPALCAQHLQSGSQITVALAHVEDTSRFGQVLIEDSRIVAFREKGRSGEGWINGGVYVLARDLLETIDLSDPFSFETDFLTPRLTLLAPGAYCSASYFIDIGIPEDYLRAQEELPALITSRRRDHG